MSQGSRPCQLPTTSTAPRKVAAEKRIQRAIAITAMVRAPPNGV